MALYIDLGTNVDPDWLGLLAISNDGVNWDTVNIIAADVKSHTQTGNTDSPLVSNAFEIHLSILNDREEIAHISLIDVVNQPTWTNDAAGELQAKEDIADWIGAANSVGGAAMMAGGLALDSTVAAVKTAIENLNMDVDTVNLNVDGLEALIGGVGGTNEKLDTIETTLDSIEDEIALVPNAVTANIASTVGSVVLRASNVNRREVVIHNNSTAVNEVLFVKKEPLTPTGATTTDYTFRVPYLGTVIIDDFHGEISGTWNNAGGFAMVTETTKD